MSRSPSQQFTIDTANKVAETITARGSVYAPPEVQFQILANFWNAWINARYPDAKIELNTFDVGMMQVMIKQSRLVETPDHEDSALDLAAYALLSTGCVAKPDVDRECRRLGIKAVEVKEDPISPSIGENIHPRLP